MTLNFSCSIHNCYSVWLQHNSWTNKGASFPKPYGKDNSFYALFFFFFLLFISYIKFWCFCSCILQVNYSLHIHFHFWCAGCILRMLQLYFCMTWPLWLFLYTWRLTVSCGLVFAAYHHSQKRRWWSGKDSD